MPIFGDTRETDGESRDTSENWLRGNRHVCPDNGIGVSMSFWVKSTDGSAHPLAGAVWDEGKNLIGYTEAAVVGEDEPAWWTIPFAAGHVPTFEAGKDYYMGVCKASGQLRTHFTYPEPTPFYFWIQDFVLGSPWPDPLVEDGSMADELFGIRVAYEKAAGGSGAVGGLGPSVMGTALGLAAFGSRGAGGVRPF